MHVLRVMNVCTSSGMHVYACMCNHFSCVCHLELLHNKGTTTRRDMYVRVRLYSCFIFVYMASGAATSNRGVSGGGICMYATCMYV
jgi:hypothetical protein